MKLKIRIDENNSAHTRFTVFTDGTNCGQLCMRSREAFVFINILTETKKEYLEVEVESIP